MMPANVFENVKQSIITSLDTSPKTPEERASYVRARTFSFDFIVCLFLSLPFFPYVAPYAWWPYLLIPIVYLVYSLVCLPIFNMTPGQLFTHTILVSKDGRTLSLKNYFLRAITSLLLPGQTDSISNTKLVTTGTPVFEKVDHALTNPSFTRKITTYMIYGIIFLLGLFAVFLVSIYIYSISLSSIH